MTECYCEVNRTLSGIDWLALSNDILGVAMVLLGVVLVMALGGAIASFVWFVIRELLEFVHGIWVK